ncbi:MAG: sugar phosphate isomerase/epimerase [Kiritimatiellales bacterium]|nr:sugar phosphate isomerase/epimerase [Kiritimatiellales bacterium]
MKTKSTKRELLKAAAVGAVFSGINASGASAWAGKAGGGKLKLGLASYTFRKFDLDETIKMTKQIGLEYICLKSMHMPMESTPAELQAIAAKVRDAGLVLHGGGVVKMKKPQEIDAGFEYAKNAGLKMLVISPDPKLLPLIDTKVKEYDVTVAIHNHGPGDNEFPTPMAAYDEIKKYDARIGFCHDIGHTMRMGIDPVEETIRCADRLHDVHFKDVTVAAKEGKSCITGRGVIDIVKMVRTLKSLNYGGVLSFEYEAEDPYVSLAESVGYTRGVMAAI